MLDIKIEKKLDNFILDIDIRSDDRVLAIVGKSGSGKTTLLRCIAGLEEYKGRVIASKNISIVFQNYALFPNMSVLENLKFAKNDIKKISKLINLMELNGLENRYPHTLSGGEKQRVALARALVVEPDILLLDEPFSALNYQLKKKLYSEIEFIKENFDIQIVLISHDLGEVYRLANRVIEIEYGKVIKDFTPTTKYAKLISKDNQKILIEVDGEIYKVDI